MYVFTEIAYRHSSIGPFSNSEMADWFSHGYFTMGLLVKRTTDEAFQPLGEVIKQWGRVPFVPGPQPPPFKVENDSLDQDSVFPFSWFFKTM